MIIPKAIHVLVVYPVERADAANEVPGLEAWRSEWNCPEAEGFYHYSFVLKRGDVVWEVPARLPRKAVEALAELLRAAFPGTQVEAHYDQDLMRVPLYKTGQNPDREPADFEERWVGFMQVPYLPSLSDRGRRKKKPD